MGWKLKGYMNPMDPNYHVEIDDSDFLTGDNISKYRMMVGSLNWLVILGHYDVHYTGCTLAQHMMMPRQGHLHAMRRAFGYLKQNYKFSIHYDIREPDFSMHKIEEYDWFPFYGNTKEDEPYGMPEPKVHPSVSIPRDKTVWRQVHMGQRLWQGAPVKGITVLFGDNKGMITNTSLPHSTSKKQ
eukprot:14964672-Ditylum_brightwellii.AAC.1